MTRVLFVGQAPDTVDFTDPALPPGFNAEKIQAGIDLAAAQIAERGWTGDLCMIAPDDAGIAQLKKQLSEVGCVCHPRVSAFSKRSSTPSTSPHRAQPSPSTPAQKTQPKPPPAG